MITILYEDAHILVVEKPIGMESQVSSGFAPDMVSEIKKYRNMSCPTGQEPYVGVIHRLDKPVGGVMVYAKTKKAAAVLSKQVQDNEMRKKYKAVICGKPVDNVGKYVDYLLKDGKMNSSRIVDKGITGAKRAELNYRVLQTLERDECLSLVEVELITGRHHQIRVQFAGHGIPLWGDNRYNPKFVSGIENRRCNVALAACELTFRHPQTGESMTCSMTPKGDIFKQFGIE